MRFIEKKSVLFAKNYFKFLYTFKVARKKSILEKEVTAKDSSRTKKSNTKVMASAGPSGVSADTSDSGEEINSGLTRAKESQVRLRLVNFRFNFNIFI